MKLGIPTSACTICELRALEDARIRTPSAAQDASLPCREGGPEKSLALPDVKAQRSLPSCQPHLFSERVFTECALRAHPEPDPGIQGGIKPLTPKSSGYKRPQRLFHRLTSTRVTLQPHSK